MLESQEVVKRARGWPVSSATVPPTCVFLSREQVAKGVVPTFESSRERLQVVRGVERCFAEFCMIWTTARLLEESAPPEIKRDFVFHLKALAEHTATRDRHEVRIDLKTEGNLNGVSRWFRSWRCHQENM